MTSYTKTMREAREDMLQSLNESNLEKMRKAAKGAKQTLKMKDGSIEWIVSPHLPSCKSMIRLMIRIKRLWKIC